MTDEPAFKNMRSSAAGNPGTLTVKEWLDNFVAQNGPPLPYTASNMSPSSTLIWVEEPETHQEKAILGGQKGYVSYRIMFKQAGRDLITVRHRYSEFETLRKNLKDIYTPLGIYVPALPPKYLHIPGAKNSASEEYIKERTLGLSLFCEAVAASPWLRNDRIWKTFMKPSATSSLGATVGADLGTDNGQESIGEIMLRQALHQLEIPFKSSMPQRIEDVKEEIAAVEKHVKGLMDKARTLTTCERALQAAQDAVGAQLGLWADVERNQLKTLGGRAFGEKECNIIRPQETVCTTVEATSELMKAKASSEEQLWECTGIMLVVSLEQELTNLEALKEILKVHDEMLSSIESLSSRISKSEKVAQAQVIFDLKNSLEEKRANLHTFYKGLVLFSLPVFSRQRAATLRRLLGGLVSANIYTPSYPLRRSCAEFFQRLDMNPIVAAADTSRLLEQLSLRPLPLSELPLELEHVPSSSPSSTSSSPSPPTSVFTTHSTLEQLYDRALIISRGGTLPTAAFHSVPIISSSPINSTISNSRSSEHFGSPSVDGGIVGGAPGSGGTAKANPLARRGSAVLQSKGGSIANAMGRAAGPSTAFNFSSASNQPYSPSELLQGDDPQIDSQRSEDLSASVNAGASGPPRRTTVVPFGRVNAVSPVSHSNSDQDLASLPVINDNSKAILDDLLS